MGETPRRDRRTLSDQAMLAQCLHAMDAQHRAIDLLLALLCDRDKSFRPTQATPIWSAVANGHAVLGLLRQRLPKVKADAQER